MERRAASHTEEEEMNQRRKLLNAAKKGDQKAIARLFELYQVRVLSTETVNKLNRAAGLHKLRAKGVQQKPTKGIPGSKKGVFPKAVATKAKPHSKSKFKPKSWAQKKSKKPYKSNTSKRR